MPSHHYLLISTLESLVDSMVNGAMQGEDELSVVGSPTEAVALMQKALPDAVLWAMDTRDEDAVVACRTLRRISPAPIVMLVSRSAGEQILRGYRLGADAHITIPCDRREFTARVQAVLRRASATRGSPATAAETLRG